MFPAPQLLSLNLKLLKLALQATAYVPQLLWHGSCLPNLLAAMTTARCSLDPCFPSCSSRLRFWRPASHLYLS